MQSEEIDLLVRKPEERNVTTIKSLRGELDECFKQVESSGSRVDFGQLEEIFSRINLTTSELNQYKFWDSEKSYTRNLVYTDDKHYTILLLCWTPGRMSPIHDHPCDACFIKCLSGAIKEVVYEPNSAGEMCPTQTKFLCDGQTSYLTGGEDIGFHSVGNPSKDLGAVTLHLYTPPFSSCRCWCDSANLNVESAKVVSALGFYSVCGVVAPPSPSSIALPAHVDGIRRCCEELRTKQPQIDD